jgi:hypothetical protein
MLLFFLGQRLLAGLFSWSTSASMKFGKALYQTTISMAGK